MPYRPSDATAKRTKDVLYNFEPFELPKDLKDKPHADQVKYFGARIHSQGTQLAYIQTWVAALEGWLEELLDQIAQTEEQWDISMQSFDIERSLGALQRLSSRIRAGYGPNTRSLE